MGNIGWQKKDFSKTERKAAREVFDQALEREKNALLEEFKEKVNDVKNPNELWELQSFLTERTNEIEKKYDYRYSNLRFLFSRLMIEGWVEESDLQGLDEEKIETLNEFAEQLRNMTDEE